MKRLISAVLLLFACFLLSLYGWHALDKRSNELITVLEASARYVEENDKENALSAAKECNDKWNSHETVFCVFIDHKFIEAIDIDLPTIQTLIKDGKNDLALEKIEECINSLKSVADDQRVNIENIF